MTSGCWRSLLRCAFDPWLPLLLGRWRSDRPNRGPGRTSIQRAINTEIGTEINQVCITRVLQDRIGNQASRHTAHRRTPRFAIIVTDKKKAATRCSVDCRGIDTIGDVAVGNNRISKPPTVSSIRRDKRFASVSGNHYAIVIRSYVDRFGPGRMNGYGIDLKLARCGYHPGVGIAPTF